MLQPQDSPFAPNPTPFVSPPSGDIWSQFHMRVHPHSFCLESLTRAITLSSSAHLIKGTMGPISSSRTRRESSGVFSMRPSPRFHWCRSKPAAVLCWWCNQKRFWHYCTELHFELAWYTNHNRFWVLFWSFWCRQQVPRESVHRLICRQRHAWPPCKSGLIAGKSPRQEWIFIGGGGGLAYAKSLDQGIHIRNFASTGSCCLFCSTSL